MTAVTRATASRLATGWRAGGWSRWGLLAALWVSGVSTEAKPSASPALAGRTIRFNTAPAAAQNPSRPLTMQVIDFSWPLPTGTVVPAGATAVVLDGGMGFQMRFRLPADCGALDEAVRTYGDDGTNAFLRQVESAREFCARAKAFTIGSSTASRNFVSRVDFTSLSLDLIPYDLRCRGVGTEALADLSARVRKTDTSLCTTGTLPAPLSYANFLARTDPVTNRMTLDCRPARVDATTCRLTKAVFVGAIDVRVGVVRCTAAPLATTHTIGMRLSDVSFRDVNRDGLMDAILTVVEDGDLGTAPPGWFSFALTKRSLSAPLERVPLD